MSKQQTRRKISLDSPLKQVHSNPIKDSPRRPSVFERLGTKAISSNPSQCPINVKPTDSLCRQWELNGTCQYGKNCKYVSTHALISPSKRAAIKDVSSKINNKSCSSSSTSGSSSTDSDSTSSEETSSTGSSESVESSRHHRHKAKHSNTSKVKRYSSPLDKEHTQRNILRTGKGISPSKKSSHSASLANVGNLHREMKHSKKRRSRDRSDGHSSPRKGGLGSASGSKKSLSPPVRSSNANIHKRRSQSPLLKGGKQTVSNSKLGLGGRSSIGQHNARSPPSSHKDKHNRSVSPRTRERERERNREKEEKDREREREVDREREREREREKDREKERDRDKRQREKEREPEKIREREKERDKDRNRSRSPKIKLKDSSSRSPRKDLKRKESPDHHSKSNRLSGGSQKGRDDNLSSKHKVSPNDIWYRENRKDDKDDERKRADERRHKDDLRKDIRPLDDKDHIRDRERERMHDRDREKDKSKSQQGIPSLLTLNLQHNPNDFTSHVGGGVKERGAERNRSLERTGHLRNLSIDRGRERSLDRMSERSRGSERDRRCRNNNGGLEKGLDHSGLEKELAKALARNREQERTFERNDRIQDRGLDRGLDRNQERGLDRSHDRSLDRGLERGLDRGLDRSLERGLDRGHERGLDRGLERGHDRPHERGPDRCLERGLKGDRGLDRGSPRVDRDSERGLERGLDRDPVHGRLERGLERSLERAAMGSPRLDRDHRFSERSPGDRLFGTGHMDHNREQDDKVFDNSFESRRERGRFSEQGRYDKSALSNDDRRLGPDLTVFPEERRRGRDGGRQEVRGGQWEARNDRKRDHNHERDHGPRGYDGGPRPSGPNNPAKRNDWEWEGRVRRSGKEWDGPHRNENALADKEWNRFQPNQSDWSGDRRSGGWNDEWRQAPNQPTNPIVQSLLNRPPGRMLPLRDDSLNNTPHKSEEHIPDENSKVKDQTGLTHEAKIEVKADAAASENSANLSLSHKKVCDVAEGDESSAESKRLALEKDSALEEVLSDISDDADEILNREDSELNQTTHGDTAGVIEKETLHGNVQSALPPQAGPGIGSHRRTVDGAEGVGNLGFEEISDGELEEEARARGISDALGVDWASLVAETRPRAKIDKGGSTRQHWEGVRLLTYIGVSVEYAGPKLVEYLLKSAFNPQSDPGILVKEPTSVNHENVETSKDTSEHLEDQPSSSGVSICQDAGKSDLIRKSYINVTDNKNKSDICDTQSNTNETIKLEINTTSDSEVKFETESTSSQAIRSDPPANTKGKIMDIVKVERVQDSKPTEDVKKASSAGERTGDTDLKLGNLFCEKLLHPVAGIHTALLERRARRQALFNCSGPYKRALSARRDLSIRRQLCSLPARETTCDNGPAVDELFRLSLQLLERAS
ncbi:Fl(2)d-associated complex component [Frankliniella fusca]|uniref:Fl(2)d-associated complex component n=1 Tax=Frankliniella fusca TaxID=407009 RepID=A0AAE1HED1_9NEOP|nr:Fl(2)d-associated complex component [Frankliniella fusca]